jgi:iron-sulfur cluster insertion protein
MTQTIPTEVQTVQPQMMHVTDAAARKIYELLQDENDPALKLRVYIEGGGCSGFQYGFTFDNEVKSGDFQIKRALESVSITVIVDPLSYQYLVGATIDYQDDLEGERFIIKNPNAATSCSCGSSFSM